MKSLKYACALVAVAAASQAQATSYAWCEIDARRAAEGRSLYYLSGIVEIEDGIDALIALQDGPFGKGFRDYVRSQLDDSIGYSDCKSEDSLWAARDRIKTVIAANSHHMLFRDSGWLGGRPAAIEHAQPKRRGREGDLILTMPGQDAAPPAKRTNSAAAKQQWEIDYENKMEVYRQELARQQEAVAAYEREKARTEQMRAEARARAEKAQAEWKAAVAACRAGDHSQ